MKSSRLSTTASSCSALMRLCQLVLQFLQQASKQLRRVLALPGATQSSSTVDTSSGRVYQALCVMLLHAGACAVELHMTCTCLL